MKKFLLAFLKYFIGFGIGGFLVWWSFHNMSAKDIADLKASILRARFILLIPVFAILMLSHYFRALRWKQMLQPMGYNPPAFHLLCSILIGYIGNQLIPRAGEILRCSVIARKDKIPVEKLIGTVIAERVLDLLCLAILCVIVFFAEYNHIQAYADEIFTKAEANIEGGGSKRWLTIGIIIFVIILLVYVARRFKKTKWGAAIIKVLRGMWEGLVSVKNVQRKPLFYIYTVMIWVCYALSTWIGCFAMQETAGLSLTTAVALLIFGTFGIIIAPGGLGAYPIAIQKTLGFYGINSNIGLAVGWILWLAQFIFTLIFGTAAYIALTMSKIKMKNTASIPHKIYTLKQLQNVIAGWRLLGKKIAFTNGCFDILHEGHIASLSQAANEADYLIVGVNADASTKRLKGPERPINNEHSRALILASLVITDAVIIFEEDTPLNLITALQPDVIVKGGDYTIEQIVGAKEVIAYGGRVVINPILAGFSTTGIIGKIRKLG